MITDSRQVDFLWRVRRQRPSALEIDSFFEQLMDCLKCDGEVAILITHDQKMRKLNRQFRGKDETTDVLSFPRAERGPGDERHLGDIVISYDQAKRQAEEIGQPIENEIRFLCLHGMLHLLGYDHETDNGEMLQLQAKLKKKLAHFF